MIQVEVPDKGLDGGVGDDEYGLTNIVTRGTNRSIYMVRDT